MQKRQHEDSNHDDRLPEHVEPWVRVYRCVFDEPPQTTPTSLRLRTPAAASEWMNELLYVLIQQTINSKFTISRLKFVEKHT